MNARKMLGLVVVSTVVAGIVSAQTTRRVSVSSSGAQGTSTSLLLDVSDDGDSVLFSSWAPNLVPGDTNLVGDVFVHTRSTGVTVQISVNPSGVAGNGESEAGSISADGRFVAFSSLATDLVPGDTNGKKDVFVRDLVLGTTARVNLSGSGAEADDHGHVPSISADGRFVAFVSQATNLLPGAVPDVLAVYVRDRQTNTTVRASADGGGTAGNGHSFDPAIAADGRSVVFASAATNLIPNDTNGVNDVFQFDLMIQMTSRISRSSTGAQLLQESDGARCSGDGRIVIFHYLGNDAVPTDSNGAFDVFARDIVAGTTTLVSVDHQGQPIPFSDSYGGNISADGRYVAFETPSSLVDPGDLNPVFDVFVLDRQTGGSVLVSRASGGFLGNGPSYGGWLSADGSVCAFHSWASSLVPGDTNMTADVFVNDRSGPVFHLLCFGDGSAAACPCGNASPAGLEVGCLNSGGQGASLRASGTPRISADSVLLQAAGMRNGACLFFQGTDVTLHGTGVAFGDGVRCASGTNRRLAVKSTVGGAAQYPEPSDLTISVRGLCQPGHAFGYQVWYRDAQPFCTAAGHNMTNAAAFYWRP